MPLQSVVAAQAQVADKYMTATHVGVTCHFDKMYMRHEYMYRINTSTTLDARMHARNLTSTRCLDGPTACIYILFTFVYCLLVQVLI